MRVDRGTVRAPEIGRIWLNSTPLSLRQLRGRAVLIDFWDYTCANCIRTLPYIQQWHERYADKGLTVIGVHTPEFTFAQYESNVERGIRDFGLSYPIVIDSGLELWKQFANRYWPSKYVIDAEGYLRWAHFGEGAYGETETVIQELLHEIDPTVTLPPLLDPACDTDHPGAVCFAASPETYLGNRRGRYGNPNGLREDQISTYTFTGEMEESFFYLVGQWASTAEYAESIGDAANSIHLTYSAVAVNLVLASPRHPTSEVVILQDGKSLARSSATRDTQFRDHQNISSEYSDLSYDSYLTVTHPRMYALVANPTFGTHTLELRCATGIAAFAFTFTSCLDPRHNRQSL